MSTESDCTCGERLWPGDWHHEDCPRYELTGRTPSPDPRAVGAHECPRCGQPYSFDGCGCKAGRTPSPDPRAVGAHECPRCGQPYSFDGCGCKAGRVPSTSTGGTVSGQRHICGYAEQNGHHPLCDTEAARWAYAKALSAAWQIVDRAVTPLGYYGGASNSPWNQGYEQAKNEATNALFAALQEARAALGDDGVDPAWPPPKASS